VPSTTVTASHVTQDIVVYESTIPRSSDKGLALWEASFNPEYEVIMTLSDHFPPPSAKIMNTWNSTFIHPYSLHGIVLNLSTTWSFKHHPTGSIVTAADVHIERQKGWQHMPPFSDGLTEVTAQHISNIITKWSYTIIQCNQNNILSNQEIRSI
jgi:hypothetical protein